MGMIEDLVKALDRIPIWQRLGEVPGEVDELKKRIAVLEEKVADLEETLGGKWPADVCQFCGERAARLSFSQADHDKGHTREEWECEQCGQFETRLVTIRRFIS